MSETRNQHFISQVEQRLNACNPSAHPSNQRIYQFKVIDRSNRTLRLVNERGRSIARSLSMLDLFSFDVDQVAGTRANLEAEFDKYEKQLKLHTERILASVSHPSMDISEDAIALFAAKMMNFVRNPFCVQKVINTFGQVAEHYPANKLLYERYLRVLDGNKPHRAHLCRTLSLSDNDYSKWLRLLFMMLTPMMEDLPNILEGSLQTLFQSRDNEIAINVYSYDNERCLLSDRSHSTPAEERALILDFNLDAKSFIRYCFIPHSVLPISPAVRESLLPYPKTVNLRHERNDLAMLKIFHHRVVEQAFDHVYCSSKTPYSATVIH